MTNTMLNTALLISLLIPTTLNATWSCEAKCQYYSTHLSSGASNIVEVVVDGETQLLSRRMGGVSSRKDTLNRAYEALLFSCFDLAAAHSSSFITVEGYSPTLLEKTTLNTASKSSVCWEEKVRN